MTKCWPDENPTRSFRRGAGKGLRKLGYTVTRQSGSHLRITTQQGGEHHEVIPNHSLIKIGTLTSILRNVAAHHKKTVAELLVLMEL